MKPFSEDDLRIRMQPATTRTNQSIVVTHSCGAQITLYYIPGKDVAFAVPAKICDGDIFIPDCITACPGCHQDLHAWWEHINHLAESEYRE